MDSIALKHRLLDKGMTLAALALQVEMSYDRLIKVVNGYREPRADEIRRIAAALGMRADDLHAPRAGRGDPL